MTVTFPVQVSISTHVKDQLFGSQAVSPTVNRTKGHSDPSVIIVTPAVCEGTPQGFDSLAVFSAEVFGAIDTQLDLHGALHVESLCQALDVEELAVSKVNLHFTFNPVITV